MGASLVAGARRNFMKITRVVRTLQQEMGGVRIVHTGSRRRSCGGRGSRNRKAGLWEM
jgi:hypothetical protein